MSNRFKEHESDGSPSTEDIAEAQNRATEVWSYDGEHDLSVKDPYLDPPVSNGLDHVSKSRIKTAIKCYRNFGYKYLGEVREGDNYYFARGTAIHETFERFYENLEAFVAANGEPPERFTDIIGPADDWFQWIEYIGPFFEWELDRWSAAVEATDSRQDAIGVWVPHSVEQELRVTEPPVGTLDWMGPYDVLYHAASVPSVNETEGYVVGDYKTGSVKDEQYRPEGIHIDLEFYGWMLGCLDYDVVAGIGIYPTENENVVRHFPNPETRADITEIVQHFHSAEATTEDFPINPNPLCSYCFYQQQCPTNWE